MSQATVAVLFGGRSSEHGISCVSAGSILDVLDRERFEVLPVGITRAGRWVLAPDDPAAMRITDGTLPEVADGPEVTRVTMAADPSVGGLLCLDGPRAGEVIGVDVVFPVLHGPFGEDGTLQGLLEMAGLPYVGSGVLASAAGMDKQFTKVALRDAGIAVAADRVLRRGESLTREDTETLGLPVFVKPARAGSSVGITRVTDWSQLDTALEKAFEVDSKVVVESEIKGREIECGVLQSSPVGGAPEASLPAEIRLVAGRAWYDFEAKYLDDVTEFDVPADLDDATLARLRDSARRAFEALGCEGLARVDFFLLGDGSLVVNEVNTMPGFTPVSMFPRMWAQTGVPYDQLVDRLLGNALERGAR